MSAALLSDLERAKGEVGRAATARLRRTLSALRGARMPTASDLFKLHELALWHLAYPSAPGVRTAAERLLRDFDARPELARFRGALADSGLAGTPIHYRFYWPLARWLARRWPEQLSFDGADLDPAPLERWLPRLVAPAEAAAVASDPRPVQQRLQRLAQPGTDATFWVRGLEGLDASDRLKEAIHDDFDHPYRLAPGPGGPSRTHAQVPVRRLHLRAQALSRARPELRLELERRPKLVNVAPAQAEPLIDRAREAMVTRSRDLEVFGYGDPKDVAMLEDGQGLRFVAIGFTPERRLQFQGTYGLLTLQNGVPIGYVQLDGLLGHVEVSFNTFETFRGGESARILARTMAAARVLLGARSFSIEPYQLGDHNQEAIDSGAWWFYYKLGFRPHDRRTLALVARELRAQAKRPEHRSSPGTLGRLAQRHLYWTLDPKLRPPGLDFARLSALARAELASRGGPRAEAEAEAMAELDAWTSRRGRLRPEQAAEWRRWAPLLLALPDLDRWTRSERTRLAQVVLAKAGRRARDFVALFDAHPRLPAAFRDALKG